MRLVIASWRTNNMRLLYATSITLPSYRANRIQITSMARAWTSLLGEDFMLGVGSADEEALRGINYIVMGEHLRSYRLAWSYLSYAQKNRFTHIYCREEKVLLFMNIYNTLFFRMPITFCYELHHLVYMDVWWHTLLLKRVNRVISITGAMKSILIKNKYPESRILVAPDAVDLSLFVTAITRNEARMRLGLPPDKKIVIYTGAINEPWKGVGTLYEAAKQFDDSYLFLIVGGKPHYVDNFRSQYPDRSNFLLRGHKPHVEMPLYLRSADVAVLPNSSTSEISRVSTSPMKLFEYMASGVPIVASDLPSIREIVSEEHSVLVVPDDPSALALGIQKALIDEEETQSRVANAQELAHRYTWDNRAKEILSFIQ